MSISEPSIKESTPAIIRVSTILVSLAVAISAIPWIWMAIGKFGGFAWGLFGFELIVLFGCLTTILVCIGKIRVGFALPLAIACLAGTILVDMVFGMYVDARAVVGDDPTIGPWISRTILFRLIAMGLLTFIATLDVYRRDTRSWGMFFRAMIFLLPVIGVLGWIKMRGFPISSGTTSEPSSLAMVVLLLGGLIIGILFSIGGHFFIRSYEVGLNDEQIED